MTIVLVVILSIISISLRILASSIELASKVSSRIISEKEKGSVGEIVGNSLKAGLTVSSKALKFTAFVISRVRDLILGSGLISILLTIVILIVIIATVSTFTIFFI